MQERERSTVTGLVVLMLLLWGGFLVHRSPRFPGSLAGGLLGIAAALLMLVPLAYLVVKRMPALRQAVTRKVSMRTLLAWHIYAGIVGPILALLHSGHRFASPLGIALTAMMLVVVLSGFTGRYLMSRIAQDVSARSGQLEVLRREHAELARALPLHAGAAALLRPLSGLFSRVLVAPFFVRERRGDEQTALVARALRVADATADLEYAIKTSQTFKRAFAVWLRVHITISLLLYALLALHVGAEAYLGLRWL